ncbi:MAG: hypothetical protein WBD16_12250 [Pyrinomonadaceae bacterium]
MTSNTSVTDRESAWEIEKQKLLDAKYPLTAETRVDVNGDGLNDHITYRVQRWQSDFEGRLTIKSSKGKELWDHEFFMGSNDLAKFLVEVLEYKNSTEWVNNVFAKDAPYSFKAETVKLKANDIDDENLKYASKIHKTSAKRLKDEVLRQKKNRIYSYRAEWREDLLNLVYIPSLKYFICYSRGY